MNDEENKDLLQIPGLTYGPMLGSGHFSHVYKGSYKDHDPVTIKIIERGGKHEIEREINILKAIKGCPHTIKLVDTFEVDEHTVLIIDFVEAMTLEDFFINVQIRHFQRIISNLLETLSSVHSMKVIHRDITVNNILISPDFSDSYLIDWGCASKFGHRMRPNAGTRQARSPEMLLGYQVYKSESDIWSVGVYIWSVLCGSKVPWRSQNSLDTLINISKYFEHDEIINLADKLEIELDDEFIEKIPKAPTMKLKDMFSPKYERLFDPDLIDLMKSLLVIDIDSRPTAEQALQHPFFAKQF